MATTPDAVPISSLVVADSLVSGDFVAILRTSAPDPKDKNLRVAADVFGGGAAAAQDALTPASATKPPSVNAVVAGLLQKVDKASMLHQTTLAAAQQFLLPNRSLEPNTLYLLMGAWNGGDPGQAVIIPATTAGGFAAIGYIRANNKPVAVVADVAAGVYVELDTSAPFDPYEVSLAIRQAVVDGFAAQDAAANDSPFLDEPQPSGSLVGMEFLDPQAEYLYKFRPVAFANGCFNVWVSTLLSR